MPIKVTAHKSHDHNTNECTHLKNAIEVVIKKGRLTKYTRKGDRKDGQEKKRKCRG